MRKICLLLLLLQSSLLHAQEFKLTKSKEFDIRDGFFLKIGDNYIRKETDYRPAQLAYTAKLSKVRYTINLYKYDTDMKEVKKLSLDDNQKIIGPFISSTFTFNNKLLTLYYRYIEDANIIKAYLVQVNPEDLTIETTKEVFTIGQKDLGFLKAETLIEKNGIITKFSPDSSKMLIASCNEQFIFSCIIDAGLNITSNTVIRNKNMEGFYTADAFLDNAGNKYFSYRYIIDKENKRGIVTESYKGGQAKFQEFKTMQADFAANDLYFASSKNNSKVYIQANYYGNLLNEGVLLTTIDTGSFKIAKPQLFAYPDDYKQRLEKEDFAEKKKGNISVRRTEYKFYELNNGTIALVGSPNNWKRGERGELYTFSGPILGIFIQPANKAVFSMIPKSTFGASASILITKVVNNQIICLYGDKEKNLSADLNGGANYVKSEEDLVLALAIFDSNGNVTSRKKVADVPGHNNYYFLSEAHQVNAHSYLIPIGRDRTGMNKYYTEYNQLAVLELQ